MKNLLRKINFPLYNAIIGFLLFFITLSVVNQTFLKNNTLPFSSGVHTTYQTIHVLAWISAFLLGCLLSKSHFSKKSIGKLLLLFAGFTFLKILLTMITTVNFSIHDVSFSYLWAHLLDANFAFLFRFIALSALAFLIMKWLLKTRLSPLSKRIPENNFALYVSFLSLLTANSNLGQQFFKDWVFSRILRFESRITMSDFFHMSFNILVIFALIYVSCILLYKGLKDFRHQHNSFALIFMSSFGVAFFSTFFLQFFITGSSATLQVAAFILETTLLSAIFLMLYALINRYVIASLICLLLGALLVVSNAMKFQFRQEPITLEDLSWLKTPLQLLGFVGQINWFLVLISVLVLVLAAFVAHRHFFKGKTLHYLYQRGLLILLAFLPIFYLNGAIAKSDTWVKEDIWIMHPSLLQNVIANMSSSAWKGTSWVSAQQSFAFSIIHQAHVKLMAPDSQYSKARMDEIAQKYTLLAQQINKARTEQIQNQTVVYVLSESLANPNRVPGITLSGNPLPFIDTVTQNNGGLMISNGYGGGTANIEFEAMTSLSKNNFDPSLSIIYNSAIPKMDYIPSISNLFTRRVIIHPDDANNYNRNLVYQKLNFTDFVALEHGTKKVTDVKDYGKYPSDATSYANLLDELQAGKPQFLELLTMQNHMPYTGNLPSLSALTARDNSKKMSPTQMSSLNYYTQLISQTDTETQNFLSALTKLPQKVTVVFYGDHLPGLYPENIFAGQEQAMRETDYFIWNNHGPETHPLPVTSSYLFTAQLLQATNSKVTPYYALMTENMLQLPIMQNQTLYDKTSGAILSNNKLSAAQAALEEDYKLVQYDLTVGKGYLKKDFFESEPDPE